MSNAVVNIRTDAKTKKQAEELFSNLGISMTAAINMFLKQSIMHDGLPFKVVMHNIPNKETIEAMEETEDMIKHPEKYKSYNNVDELFEDILC